MGALRGRSRADHEHRTLRRLCAVQGDLRESWLHGRECCGPGEIASQVRRKPRPGTRRNVRRPVPVQERSRSTDEGCGRLRPRRIPASRIPSSGPSATLAPSRSIWAPTRPSPVDFPDVTDKVGRLVQSGEADRGILVCGSGIGACIAANKMKGIYASICHDTYSAAQGVVHDDMNVLCLGGRVVGPELADALIRAFLGARYRGTGTWRRALREARRKDPCY